jgi:hypothetical protein
MVYELRIYTRVPGRVAALHTRFQRAETERDGPLVARMRSQILAPTSYSGSK